MTYTLVVGYWFHTPTPYQQMTYFVLPLRGYIDLFNAFDVNMFSRVVSFEIYEPHTYTQELPLSYYGIVFVYH